MRCSQARLDAYLDGELAPFERGETESHLEECPACARELEALALASAAVKAWEPPPAVRGRGRRGVVVASAVALVLAAALLYVAGRQAGDAARSPSTVRHLVAGEHLAHGGRRVYVADHLAQAARIDCGSATLLAGNARFEVEETTMLTRTKAALTTATAVTVVAVIWGSVDSVDRATGDRTTLHEGRHVLPEGESVATPPADADAAPAQAAPDEEPFDPFTGVTGLVVDTLGTPVPGATVELEYGRPGSYAGSPPDRTTTAGADGRFRIASVRAYFALAAFKPGVGAGGTDAAQTPGGDVTIRLEPAARLEGRLIDAEDGSPVAGAICLTRSAGGGWHHERAVSGEDGRFVLETCDPRKPYLWVRPVAHETLVCAPSLEAGGSVRVDFPLRRIALRHVRVVDSVSKQPVHVEKAWSEGHPERTVRITGEGEIEFHAGTSRTMDLVIEARGYPPAYFQFGFGQELTTFELDRGRLLRIQAMDEQGKPVAGARVSFYCQPIGPPIPALTTGREGVAETPIPSGLREITASVEAEGFARAGTAIPPGTEPVAEAEVVLRRAGVLLGRVVDARGAAVSGARLDAGSVRGHSGADGRFRVDGVPAGDGKLKVTAPEFVPREVPFTVEAGRATDVGDLRVEPGAEVAGRAVDAGGAPVALTAVWVQGRQGEVSRDGTFRVGGLPPGAAVELQVYCGPLHQTVETVAGTRDLLVQLGSHASIRGRVTVQDGARLPLGLFVSASVQDRARRAAPGPGQGGFVGTDGTFRIDDVAAGTYLLYADVSGDAFPPVSAEVTVRAGETAMVTLVLAAGGAIEGRVATGGSTGNFMVRITPLDGDGPQQYAARRFPTSEEFLSRTLPAGRYAVAAVAYDPGWRGTGREVLVGARTTVRCDLSLVQAGELIVRAEPGTKLQLLGQDGAEVAPCEEERRVLLIGVRREDWEAVLTTAGTDGAWHRRALLPGTYTLVTPDGQRSVNVAAGQVAEVDLTR